MGERDKSVVVLTAETGKEVLVLARCLKITF